MRNQKRKNNNWPKYVSEANGRIVYRPRFSKDKWHLYEVDKQGFLRPPIKLGKVGDSESAILRAYIKANDDLETSCSPSRTLFWVREQWLKSRQFVERKGNLQNEYELRSMQFLEYPIKINRNKTAQLGNLLPHQVKKVLLRNIIDKALERYRQKGMHGASTINGQFAAFSAMISWAIEYIADIQFEHGTNPCFGVKRLETRKRERYVTDEEYKIQYNFACENAPKYLPVFFEFTYLLACRGIETRELEIFGVDDEGITVARRKGSKTNKISWSKRLRENYDKAMELRKGHKITTTYLVPNCNGRMITKEALSSVMSRFKEKMKKADLGDVYWTLHDLKHKGISDAKDKNIGGHRDPAMIGLYNHEVEVFAPPR